MARYFTATSSQYIYRAAAAVTAAPLTLAGWYKPASTSGVKTVCCLAATTGAGNAFFLVGLSGALAIARMRNAAGTTGTALSVATSATGVWVHLAAVFTDSTHIAVFINGSKTAAVTSAVTPASVDATSVGATHSVTDQQYANGAIERVGIWNTNLSDSDVGLLASGYDPRQVNAAHLVGFVPCYLAEDYDHVAGAAMTPVASPTTVADHPTLYCRRRSPMVHAIAGSWVRRSPAVDSICADFKRRCPASDAIAGAFKASGAAAESVTADFTSRSAFDDMLGSFAQRGPMSDTLLAFFKGKGGAADSVCTDFKSAGPISDSVVADFSQRAPISDGLVHSPFRSRVGLIARVAGAQLVRCYKNTTDGGPVDLSTPFAEWAFGGPYVTPALAAGFRHRFIIRRFNGYYEDANLAESALRLDGGYAKLDDRPGMPTVHAVESASGSAVIRATYTSAGGENATPSAAQLFGDNGTGSIDWGDPLDESDWLTAPSGERFVQFRVSGLTAGEVYLFAVRAATVDGVLSAQPAPVTVAIVDAVPVGVPEAIDEEIP